MGSSFYYSKKRKQLSMNRSKKKKKRRIADLLELTAITTGFSSRKLILTGIRVTMALVNVSMMIGIASLSVTNEPHDTLAQNTTTRRVDLGFQDINNNVQDVNSPVASPRRQRERQQNLKRLNEEQFRQRKTVVVV